MRKEEADLCHERCLDSDSRAAFLCSDCQGLGSGSKTLESHRNNPSSSRENAIEVIKGLRLHGHIVDSSALDVETLVTALTLAVKALDDDAYNMLRDEVNRPHATEPETLTCPEDSFSGAFSDPNTQRESQDTASARLCKTVWSGEMCTTQGCKFAHPPRCQDPSCRPQRRPECRDWHTIRKKKKTAHNTNKSGNHKKGSRSSPPTKRAPGKQATSNLRLEADLAKTRLALLKARSKASQARKDVSYASMVTRNLGPPPSQRFLAPQLAMPCAQATPVAPSSAVPVPPSAATTGTTSLPEAALQNLANQLVAVIMAAFHQ